MSQTRLLSRPRNPVRTLRTRARISLKWPRLQPNNSENCHSADSANLSLPYMKTMLPCRCMSRVFLPQLSFHESTGAVLWACCNSTSQRYWPQPHLRKYVLQRRK
eukprot:PhF_6_TR7582/c0_g1_i1/m.11158